MFFKEKKKENEGFSSESKNIGNIESNNYVLRDEYEMLKARVYKLERLVNKEEEK